MTISTVTIVIESEGSGGAWRLPALLWGRDRRDLISQKRDFRVDYMKANGVRVATKMCGEWDNPELVEGAVRI